MKIAVMNFSGNVGKSTVCRHLLAPRIPGATVVAVETINSHELEARTMRAKDFGDLHIFLQGKNNVIVDIGASNVEEYLKLMRQFHGSHDDYDYFLIPTVPGPKQQIDTISTIRELALIGVAAKNIRLLFNMVDVDQPIKKTFAGLVAYQARDHAFVLNEMAVIYTNELYSRIIASRKTIAEILHDESDFKALIRDTKDPEKKVQFAALLANKRLAAGVSRQLDVVFEAVFQ